MRGKRRRRGRLHDAGCNQRLLQVQPKKEPGRLCGALFGRIVRADLARSVRLGSEAIERIRNQERKK